MLLVKLIVLLLLGFVIVSLFSGLYSLVKDKGQTNRTVNALSVRIGLSIVAIVVVMVAGATGVIELNPSPLSAQTTEPATERVIDGNEERSGGGRRPIVDGS